MASSSSLAAKKRLPAALSRYSLQRKQPPSVKAYTHPRLTFGDTPTGIGHISGCHLNLAVSIGLTVAGRFPARDLVPYIVPQVVGGLFGAYVLSVIASGVPGFDLVASGFATNGYGDHSRGHCTMIAALMCEVVATFFFVFVILSATDSRAPAGFAPIAIGLCLTLILLISIPVTNTSVNPVLSTVPT